RWLALPVALVQGIGRLIDAALYFSNEPQDVAQLVDFVTSDVTFSMEKARTILGWQPQVSLQDGMQRSVPYLQEIGLL
ncbi:MAG: hypothetical protein KC496_15240, partial [Anaerolineae bacterium]|nr:hypothetical protein [Anaerolineae bacterium]